MLNMWWAIALGLCLVVSILGHFLTWTVLWDRACSRAVTAISQTWLASRDDQIKDLSREVEAAREIATNAEAKTARYLATITSFENQSLAWQGKWQEESISHGNAQELMMRTIAQLQQKLQALGHNPKIPAVLDVIRAEHEQQHSGPARNMTHKAKASDSGAG